MAKLSRRAFALGLPALTLSASGLHLRPALARVQTRTVPPLAQFAIGRFTVTALAVGFADMPFSFFTGREPKEIEEAAAALSAARSSGIRLVFNQYLIDDGERLILVDTGPAGAVGRTGQLPAALDTLGVRLDQIGAVVVTHMHLDHTGGLIAGGRRNFPAADVYVDQREVAHWTDPARRAAAPDFLQSSFDAAAEVVRLYPRLQATDGERQIARGVSLVDLTGHTPGHIGVRVEDGGRSVLIVSDMFFHPSLHPGSSDIGFVFEQDPAAARAMRARFFPRAVEEKAFVAATHMPFPGLGRIVSEDGRLRWTAAEWALQG
jgi:glyoxylase-like metal-dependent hydrolase (beta-lactamase superfamily II)